MVFGRRPVVALYLVAVGLLPWAWFPPFPGLQEHAQWADVFVAAALAAWVWDRWRARSWPRLGMAHAGLAVYLAASAASLAVSAQRREGALLWVGMVELAALFVLTADLASDRSVRRDLVRVVAVSALAAAAVAVLGLLLFYAGHTTRLIGSYGRLEASSRYARVQATFFNQSLLGDFCVFASAVVAIDDGELSVRFRRVVQGALGVAVLITFSRPILGFVVAAAIRTRRRWLAVGAGVVAVALLAIGTLASVSLDPTNPLEAKVGQGKATYRQAAQTSLESLAHHPVLGVGLGEKPGRVYKVVPARAHSTLLDVASTQGLLALAGLVIFGLGLWRGRGRPTDLAVWSGLAGVAVNTLALDVQHFRPVWILFGLANAARTVGADERHGAVVLVPAPPAG